MYHLEEVVVLSKCVIRITLINNVKQNCINSPMFFHIFICIPMLESIYTVFKMIKLTKNVVIEIIHFLLLKIVFIHIINF